MTAAPHIYVDADACPVKAETVKVAERHGLPVVFVANAWFAVPRAPLQYPGKGYCIGILPAPDG